MFYKVKHRFDNQFPFGNGVIQMIRNNNNNVNTTGYSVDNSSLFYRTVTMVFLLTNVPSDATLTAVAARKFIFAAMNQFAGFLVINTSDITIRKPVKTNHNTDEPAVFYITAELKVIGNYEKLSKLETVIQGDLETIKAMLRNKEGRIEIPSVHVFDASMLLHRVTFSDYASLPKSVVAKYIGVRQYSSLSSAPVSKYHRSQPFYVFKGFTPAQKTTFLCFMAIFCFALSVYIIPSAILTVDILPSSNTIEGYFSVQLPYMLLNIVQITVGVLLSVAYFTLAERQIMASMQRRVGPNVSGIFGLLQPIFDGLKLGVKEPVLPELSASGAFTAAPMISFILSQVSFCALFLSDAAYQGLVLMALSSLGVYGVMLSGWASNSKYAFLGCLRSVSLMVSYELGFGATLLSISLFLTDAAGMKSLNFGDVSSSIQFALLPLFFIFLVCILAETKRVPFDLPEAEAELVAGYNVEYSSLGFALFFISEYANMGVMSILASIYFLGGFKPILLTAIFFFFVWVRATLPRYRYDQFLRLGWKSLLPLSLCLYSIYAVFDYVF